MDAADLMPAVVRDAFSSAALEYLNAPDHLEALLAELDRIRELATDTDSTPGACVRRATS
ncbi:hypothetical protein [Microbispora maris]